MINPTFTKWVKFANLIFLSGALLCFVIFVYLLWTNTVHPTRYFLLIVLSILLLAVLRLKDDIKINVVIGLLSLLIFLYIAEICLFLWEPTPWIRHNARERAAKKAGIPFDIRTKWQVMKDLQEKGINAYPSVFPKYLLPDGLSSDESTIFPLSGISDVQTILCNESGEYVIYPSDQYGFNNPPSVWENERPDLMLVGDSFVHGGCVKPGYDMAGQLRRLGWNAINVGGSGNGPMLELATINEYAEPMKPKIVLWVYYEDNDFADLQKEKSSSFIIQYLQNNFSQTLIHRQTEINKALHDYLNKEIKKYRPTRDIIYIIKLSHIRYKMNQLMTLFKKNEPSFLRPDPLFLDIIRKARDRVSAWGGQLYFVYLPQWSRYVKKVDHDQWRNRKGVLSIVQELNVPIIDLHQEVFLNHPDPLSLVPLRLYGHYNAEAYKLIATAIDRHLRSQLSISDINFN